jgi:hypothetical protein
VAPDGPHELRDIAETRAALRGDDAPSRSLLGSLASSLHVKGLIVVEAPDGAKPVARVFLASTRSFDAAVYESGPAAAVTWGTDLPIADWSGALAALHRGFADPTLVPASTSPTSPTVARSPPPIEDENSVPAGKPFYTSPWFWGALAAAALAGAAFFFVSRGTPDPTIQLEVQVPK